MSMEQAVSSLCSHHLECLGNVSHSTVHLSSSTMECVQLAEAGQLVHTSGALVTLPTGQEVDSGQVNVIVSNRGVRFYSKVSQIDPQWDKSGTNQIRYQNILR